MSARMFIRLMLLVTVFTAGLFVFAKPGQKEAQTTECSSNGACSDDSQAKTTADGMIWESVSRHLLNVVQ